MILAQQQTLKEKLDKLEKGKKDNRVIEVIICKKVCKEKNKGVQRNIA
jgi:hypothetical protein